MTLPWGSLKVVVALPALLFSSVSPVKSQATEQPPPLPVSLERIREELAEPPAKRLRLDGIQTPVAVFRTTVERDYMPSFKEQL